MGKARISAVQLEIPMLHVSQERNEGVWLWCIDEADPSNIEITQVPTTFLFVNNCWLNILQSAHENSSNEASYLLPKINVEPFDILCLLKSIEALLQDTVPDVVYLRSEQWSGRLNALWRLQFAVIQYSCILFAV